MTEQRSRLAEEEHKLSVMRLAASRRQTRVIAALLAVAALMAVLAALQWRAAVVARRAAAVELASTFFREASVRAHGMRVSEGVAFAARSLRAADSVAARALAVDLLQGSPLTVAQVAHQNTVTWVMWSPDGTRVATASEDGTARVWDARTGQAVGAPLAHPQVRVYSVAWSPDGAWLATAADDKTARVWDQSPLQARDAGRLTELSETFSDWTVNETSGLNVVDFASRQRRRAELAQEANQSSGRVRPSPGSSGGSWPTRRSERSRLQASPARRGAGQPGDGERGGGPRLQNLEYFSQDLPGTEGAAGDSIGKRLFIARLELIGELDKRRTRAMAPTG